MVLISIVQDLRIDDQLARLLVWRLEVNVEAGLLGRQINSVQDRPHPKRRKLQQLLRLTAFIGLVLHVNMATVPQTTTE
jgi:hypothetical protein